MAVIFTINGTGQTPSVNYAGKTLPQDAAPQQVVTIDPTNNPSAIQLDNGEEAITLPGDTIIRIEAEKIIAESKILDGVNVIEHIGRHPYKIEFSGKFRSLASNGIDYVFPQDLLDDNWNYLWLPNTVLTLTNTYLNKLGIQQVVITSLNPEKVRGSKDVPFIIRCIENVPGTSLNLSGPVTS